MQRGVCRVGRQPESDRRRVLDAVSCPSRSFCVAVDGSGGVLTSTNPTGGRAAWRLAKIDGRRVLNSVSCPSRALCVAVDGSGGVLTSTNPTGVGRDVDASRDRRQKQCERGVMCFAIVVCCGRLLRERADVDRPDRRRTRCGGARRFTAACTYTGCRALPVRCVSLSTVWVMSLRRPTRPAVSARGGSQTSIAVGGPIHGRSPTCRALRSHFARRSAGKRSTAPVRSATFSPRRTPQVAYPAGELNEPDRWVDSEMVSASCV